MERKDAIEVIKSNWPDSSFTRLRDALETLIPELKESEDERIRKGLITHLKELREWEVGKLVPIKTSEHYDAWLTWAEKQGEHKPAWSEEDETALGDALWCCKQAASIAKDENDMGNVWYAERWLKSLPDRVQPQNTWKPSERQIQSIRDCALNKNIDADTRLVLDALYQDLKKLMEE